MREIKFRGWFECINGENYWAYGYLKKQSNGKWEIILDDDSCGYTVKHPCQYTGLKDKNGKEIYEGDVVKDDDFVMQVIFNNNFASFGLRKSGWISDHFFQEASKPENCEVIGNIYENPELIK